MVKKHMANSELLLNDNGNENNEQMSGVSKKSKIRYLLVRNENYEKQVVDLLQSLSGFARRTAKLRDAGDIVAETLQSISSAEVLNPSSKKAILEVSKTFRTIQDHRDSEILYLEDKLFPLISEYGQMLQKQREELRTNTNKVFNSNRERGLSWIRSSSSNDPATFRRRTKSLDRFNQKVEKSLQKTIQKNELKRNIIFKKLLLKLVLTELRLNIKSFNNLTFLYKHILNEMNPGKDLKYFNDFFNFPPIKKTTLNVVEENELITDNDDEDDSDSEESSTDTDDDNGDDDDDESISNRSELINNTIDAKPGTSKSLVSTLKRFNSTPEMSIQIESKLKNATSKKSNENNKNVPSSSKKLSDSDDDDSDEDDTSEDDSGTDKDIEEQDSLTSTGKNQKWSTTKALNNSTNRNIKNSKK